MRQYFHGARKIEDLCELFWASSFRILGRDNQVVQKSDDFLVWENNAPTKVENGVKNILGRIYNPYKKNNPNVPPRYYLLRGFM